MSKSPSNVKNKRRPSFELPKFNFNVLILFIKLCKNITWTINFRKRPLGEKTVILEKNDLEIDKDNNVF